MIPELRKKHFKGQYDFCPGCGYEIFINCFLEVAEEINLDWSKTVFVSGIGCGALVSAVQFKADTLHTTHGRPIAFATGVKLANPNLKVIVISGDGDLTEIGGNHLIHAARRNTPITVICLNNYLFAMTGGQTGATTPLGACTSIAPEGNQEPPFDLAKLVLGSEGKFFSRWPLVRYLKTKQGLKSTLTYEKGFAFVEIVSPCFDRYGRRNINEFTGEIFKSPAEMLKWQEKIYVPRGSKTKPNQIEFGEWREEDLVLRGELCQKK